MIATFSVQGMTCANCARHVHDALQDLPGVRTADVDLARNSVTLDAEPMPSREEIAAALDEAGYVLA